MHQASTSENLRPQPQSVEILAEGGGISVEIISDPGAIELELDLEFESGSERITANEHKPESVSTYSVEPANFELLDSPWVEPPQSSVLREVVLSAAPEPLPPDVEYPVAANAAHAVELAINNRGQ
jgi:hypothetical protein